MFTPRSPAPPTRRDETAAPPDARSINCMWMLRLRLGSLAGQLATILTVHAVMKIRLPLLPLFTLITLAAATTVAAILWLRRRPAPALLLPGLMVHDVLHLTGLLYLTGGPLNPFSFLYLVLIALSAVSMTPRFTWALAALSALCSALLFFWHQPLPLSHAEQMALHLPGMWVAFSVAALFTVYFLMRVTRALRAREHELETARTLALRREKLASLATLAAGAAHELGTPLSTIMLVAKELLRQLPPDADGLRADLDLIRASVERCRRVLDQLAADAGQSPGESLAALPVASWVAVAQEGLAPHPPIHTELAPALCTLAIFGPHRALTQALSALLKNAQDASMPSGTPVRIAAHADSGAIELTVRDGGPGMTPEVLRHAGEPFFTTKPSGYGMGLGLFLCREVIERIGGCLTLRSEPGQGTAATIRLPATASPRAAEAPP